MNQEVIKDRANLANALAEGCDFIAIVQASPGAIADSRHRKRLILLGDIRGETEEEKISDACKQAQLKMQPWDYLIKLYRLVPVPLK